MLKHYSDEDIFKLVRKVKKGDISAYGEIVRTYDKFVLGTVRSEIKNEEEAVALSEEIFLRAYKEISGFTPDKSFGFWLHGIMTGRIKDYKKKRAKEEPDGVYDAENTAEKKKSAITVESPSGVIKLINMLDDEIREAVTYRDLMGLTYCEIADLTGVTVGSAKARVTQGREKVMTALEKYIQTRAKG